jgi:DNA-binding NarL/FixJ family response regulator
MDGLEVLRRVKETHPNVDVIMITGLSQIDTAVQAMKLGAFDYISKPFEPDELKLVVQRALERRRLLQENLTLKSELGSKYRFENIIGLSPADAGRLSPHRAMRPHQFDRPDHRRKRYRQGADRPRDSLQQLAQGQAIRSGGL